MIVCHQLYLQGVNHDFKYWRVHKIYVNVYVFYGFLLLLHVLIPELMLSISDFPSVCISFYMHWKYLCGIYNLCIELYVTFYTIATIHVLQSLISNHNIYYIQTFAAIGNLLVFLSSFASLMWSFSQLFNTCVQFISSLLINHTQYIVIHSFRICCAKHNLKIFFNCFKYLRKMPKI